MSDSKQSPVPHTALHDALGLGLIALGALLGTSAVMYITRPPSENLNAYAALMSGVVELFGAAPILWICLGFLFVGGRLYLFGGERGLVRDALGFTSTGLGLAILLGALSETLGGSFGLAIGGVLHPVAGVILGLAALLIPAWAFWLRVAPPALVAKVNSLVGEDPAPETEAQAAPRRPVRNAPRAKGPTEDPSGVTSAEADALLPNAERDEILAALRTANRNSASTVNHAPSPYPADVRREGGIPAGARPIESAYEPRTTAPPAAPSGRAEPGTPAQSSQGTATSSGSGAGRAGAVHTWSAPKQVGGEVAPGPDLAGNKDARGAGAAARAPLPAGLSSPAGQRPARHEPEPATPLQGRTAAESARAIPILPAAAKVGAPTWETDEELEPEHAHAPQVEPAQPQLVGDAEVVDAYGTPLELVAELRGQSRPPEAPSTGTPAEGELADDEELLATDPWRAEDELDLEQAEEPDVEPAEVSGLEQGDELELEEEDELETEQEPLSEEEDELAGETDELDGEEADELDSEEDLDVEVDPEIDAGGIFAAGEEVEESDEIAPGSAPIPEAASAVARDTPGAVKERELVPQPVQNSLFDAPSPTPPLAQAPPERTVVLAPRAAPAAQAQSQPTEDDLVYRSGMLFLQNKRVAVSMLQREFGLDFKRATAVLDQLQEQGLIGPYLGGQRRDILLTAEEWRARVGAAS